MISTFFRFYDLSQVELESFAIEVKNAAREFNCVKTTIETSNMSMNYFVPPSVEIKEVRVYFLTKKGLTQFKENDEKFNIPLYKKYLQKSKFTKDAGEIVIRKKDDLAFEF